MLLRRFSQKPNVSHVPSIKEFLKPTLSIEAEAPIFNYGRVS
jgi:tRNA-2-methylthio-N6-dimethylallyladenosine synthase